MSFRRRIALASAAAVAVAVVLASMLTYVLTSNQLHSQVDEQLHNRARTAGRLERFLKPGGKLAQSDSERLGRDLNGLDGRDEGEAAASQEQSRAQALPRYGPTAKNLFGRLQPGPDQVRGYQQVINSAGTIVVRSAREVSLPVDAEVLAARVIAAFQHPFEELHDQERAVGSALHQPFAQGDGWIGRSL